MYSKYILLTPDSNCDSRVGKDEDAQRYNELKTHEG